MIKSPIFYMGNKERLIKKGLIELFPNNINTFIDLFCGSGVVSLNVNAKNKILIDNVELEQEELLTSINEGYMFENVKTNHSIRVEFKKVTYIIKEESE